MARVKPVGSRPVAKSPSGGDTPSGPRWKRPFQLTVFRWRLPKGMNWMIYLAIGVAVTAVAGYLVAALVFFPAPLLSNERAVNLVVGLVSLEAARDLEKNGLRDSITAREPHPTAPPGTVIWQDPPPGVAVPRGTLVSLVVSSGEPRVTVPDVRGYDQDIAQLILGAAGLHVDGIDSVDTKDVPSGRADSTSPGVGERLALGRAVMLHLAR